VAGRHWSNQLTDDVIALLNDKFVPYAPAWEGLQSGYDWWKAMVKDNAADKYKKGHERTVPGTMLWTVTSAGQTVPANTADRKTGLAGILRQVAHMYAQLPESERKPAQPIADANRPMPAPPVGGLVLTIYDVLLLRGEDGQYHSGSGQRGVPGPQRQSLWLSEAECKSLMPKTPRVGSTTAVPARLVKRIGLFGLRPATCWHVEHFWDPDSVRQGDLKLTVEEVTASGVRMRIHGPILLAKKSSIRTRQDAQVETPPNLEDRYDARVEGVVVYDPQKKRITRWDMVVLGDHVGAFWPNVGAKPSRNFTLEPVVIGFSFDLDRSDYELPPERRRQAPYLLAHTFKGEKRQPFYWDPDQWLEDWNKRKR
jgi:hypothetical protein